MAAKRADTGKGKTPKAVALKSKLDFTGSEDLATELQALRGQDITLDASAVDQLGAHAAQTLIVAARSWRSDGHAFIVTGIPDPMRAHLGIMGLEPALFGGEGAAE